MMKRLTSIGIVLAAVLSSLTAVAQNPLVSGPMVGYVEHREVMIWMETHPDVKDIAIQYWRKGKGSPDTTNVTYSGGIKSPFNPVKIRIPGLEPHTKYHYRIYLDGQIIAKENYTFTTKQLWQWRTEPPDISFLFGSCSYINEEKYDRPGDSYGKSYQIFESMAEKPSDFMIWGGDNTYLREVDWHSEYGIRYRYHHTRKTPELQALLATRAHYAIWDDHDYGPNNSNRSYYLKEASLATFKEYWPNKTYGQPDNPGTYTHFKWSDADFYLMDDRYYRAPNQLDATNEDGSPNQDKAYFGQQQLQWLKDQLLTSQSTFKVIVGGGQFLNPLSNYESFRDYPAEYQELIRFIKDHEIPGIIFLSGDRHFTELIKLEPEGSYPLYDFTSSPLTSGAPDDIGEEEDNPHRVANTLVKDQNFARIAITGKEDNRKFRITVFNAKGQEIWVKSIPAGRLGYDDEGE